ncbi:MAG: protein translocase subunit SecF [Candidatus Zixiibacteriota bacterium]|nr:MAG: protein translocase subunit SecF [candidate division Zixibacteria bacterium]
MMRIIKETNINFIGSRKFSFMFSGLLFSLGVLAFVLIIIGEANLGIDFTGGAEIIGSFENPVSVDELRNALSEVGHGKAKIQSITGEGFENSFMIRVQGSIESAIPETTFAEDGNIVVNMVAAEGDELGDLLKDAITSKFKENKFTLDSTNNISAKVGEKLTGDAIKAIVFALLGILIYIWIRFDFRFGVAATIATFHDVLAVLGIYFLLNREISLLVITALLTLAGYSLTDTVVVFDRIRENLKQFRKRTDYPSTINMSINEVLSRTIITSITTLSVVLTIMVFGGEVLFDFALALAMGILVGTYSSVFVASPVLVEWETRAPKRVK